MARRALSNVLLFIATAFVYELRRDSRRRLRPRVWSRRKFMATGAALADRLLRFPVTVKTGRVIRWRRFERRRS